MPVLPLHRNQSVDCSANQLTGFYMRATLAFNEFNRRINYLHPYYIAYTNSKYTFPFNCILDTLSMNLINLNGQNFVIGNSFKIFNSYSAKIVLSNLMICKKNRVRLYQQANACSKL